MSGADHEGPRAGADYIERLNRRFERLAGWSSAHPRTLLGLCLLLLAGAAVLAAGVRFDNSFEAYFDRDDPAYVAYLQYRQDFGSDEVSYILYEAPGIAHGPWSLEVMRKIARLTAALEDEVPFVKEVTSLVNVEYMEPIADGIQVDDLLLQFPETQEELLQIRDKFLSKPMYVGGLASADGLHAAILVEMARSSIDPLEDIQVDPSAGIGLDNLYPQATHSKIEEILARPEYEEIKFYHTGDVPLNATFNFIAEAEGVSLGLICFAVIGTLLFFFFRRPMDVAAPLIVVALSILIAIALVGIVGWKLDLMYSMLPTLLIAVGVANSVHIISEFRTYHAALGDRRAALRRTMYLVGTPCLLTSLTTAAGFGAMSIAPIKAISHFAAYSSVGVLAAFAFSVTLLVTLLSLGRATAARTGTVEARAKGSRLLQAALEAVARFDIRHRRQVLFLFVAILAVSIAGIFQLRVDSNFLSDFSEDVPVRQTTTYVDDTMGGTGSFVYLFDTGTEGGAKEPALLREIERLQTEANKETAIVKKTYSAVDLLKDINQSFQEGNPRYFAVPETRELIAQYFLVYELSGGEELREYVSEDYSRASLELRCKLVESTDMARLVERLNAKLEAQSLNGTKATITGIAALWLQLMEYITQSQIRGFLLAFVAITVMMCSLFRSMTIGALSMVSSLASVIFILGVMGWIHLPLDYTRLLIAPVAIGIAVDDAIHLMTRYRHEFLQSGSYETALGVSLRDVGRALFITSVALVCGFLVFVFSVMDSYASFGILLATTIAAALIANFLLLPALVLTFQPFGPPQRRDESLVSAQGQP
jgi:predicted RND superfamily exporter protein